MAASDTCITATLIRGKIYNYNFAPMKGDGTKNYEKAQYFVFTRNVPLTVPEEVADELEELMELETTRDGEDEIERPVFRITRDAPVRRPEDKEVRRVRMRLVAADEVRKPKLRPPVPGTLRRKIG